MVIAIMQPLAISCEITKSESRIACLRQIKHNNHRANTSHSQPTYVQSTDMRYCNSKTDLSPSCCSSSAWSDYKLKSRTYCHHVFMTILEFPNDTEQQGNSTIIIHLIHRIQAAQQKSSAPSPVSQRSS